MAEDEANDETSKDVTGRSETRVAFNSAFRNSLAATLARYGIAHQFLNTDQGTLHTRRVI